MHKSIFDQKKNIQEFIDLFVHKRVKICNTNSNVLFCNFVIIMSFVDNMKRKLTLPHYRKYYVESTKSELT